MCGLIYQRGVRGRRRSLKLQSSCRWLTTWLLWPRLAEALQECGLAYQRGARAGAEVSSSKVAVDS